MAAHALNRYCTLCDRLYDPAFRRCPRDGGRLVSLEGTLPAGSEIDGRYTIIRLIGRGGMGDVYLARRLASGTDGDGGGPPTVAIKVLHARLGTNSAITRRFLREAQAVRGLDHPNIVRVLEHGETLDGLHFIVMEYLDGRPLSTLIVREAPLRVDRTCRILSQVCDALTAAHEHGVIHRDLKPDNVFLVQGEDGAERAKVLDFGVARLLDREDPDAAVTEPGTVFGTANYMSPEQARGRPVDARADVYSLGLVLHEMLSGTHMFPGNQQLEVLLKQVHQEPVSVRSSHPHLDIPRELDDLILEALAKEPEARPASMRVFQQRLSAVLDHASSRPPQRPRAWDAVSAAPTIGARPAGARSRVAEEALAPSYTVTGAPPAPDIFVFTLPMVGRHKQRQALLTYFEGVAEAAAGQCIAIEGELGIGKTKLVEWLGSHTAARHNARLVVGEHVSHSALPMRGVRRALEDLLGVGPHSDQRVGEIIEAAAARWPERFVVDLAVLRDFLRPSPESLPEPRTLDEVWKDRLFAALARTFLAEAQERPLILVLEEVQWAQALTFQFVEYLMAEMVRTPSRLLVLLTFQQSETPDDLPFWETLRWLSRWDGHRFHRLRLERLAGAELRSLVQQICNADPALVEYVGYMAGGNPLHTLQLVRYLHNESLLESTPSGWRLRPQAGRQRPVPPALADLVELRVRRFLSRQADSSAHQRVLQRAALLGRRFPLSLLLRLLRDEDDQALLGRLDEVLDALEAEGLLRADEADMEQLVFDHGIIREVIARTLAGRRQSRRLHALVARAMEAEYAENLAEHALDIAEHYLSGGEEERAASFFMTAARAATDGLDHIRAVDALHRAEQALAECDPVDTGAWLPLWEQLGLLYVTLGDVARASSYLARLREEAEARGDTPRLVEALVGLAALARLEARWDDALTTLARAATLCEESGDRRALASITTQRGDILERRARYDEALAAHEAAAELYRALDDRRGLAGVQIATALIEEWRGETARAEDLVEAAIRLSEERGDVAGQARGWNTLAIVHLQRGQLQQALVSFEHALRLVDRMGHREAIAHTLANIGCAQILLGSYPEAREALSRSYAIRDDIGDRWGVANALNNLAAVDLGEGGYERAFRLASSAHEIYSELKSPRGVATALTNMGSAQRRLGQTDRAVRFYRDALASAPSADTRWESLGEAHEGLAQLSASAGDRETARPHYTAAIQIYEALRNEEKVTQLRAECAALGRRES